ncbi:hypothetical protein SPONN_269 [uncultured Candidatus Thioglobus sp.]|nr:hypothetical protein SPONN_269 [uncultured Candidatus Thioglobus sp.]
MNNVMDKAMNNTLLHIIRQALTVGITRPPPGYAKLVADEC